MIAGTTPGNETIQPRILSFDFARITDRNNFPFIVQKRNQKKLDFAEVLCTTVTEDFQFEINNKC